MSIPLPENTTVDAPALVHYFNAYVIIEVSLANDKDIRRRCKRVIKLSCHTDDGVVKYDRNDVDNQMVIHAAYDIVKAELRTKHHIGALGDFVYHIITDREAVLNFVNPNMDKEI